MIRLLGRAFLLLFSSSLVLGAQTQGEIVPESVPTSFEIPENWLGWTPARVYEALGSPEEVLAVVQQEIPEAIHYYSNFTYFFWYQSRVRQIRIDRRFQGSFSGLKMGLTRKEVVALLGEPLGEGDLWVSYQLKADFFPRRLRLIFEDNKLVDAYYYRSDL